MSPVPAPEPVTPDSGGGGPAGATARYRGAWDIATAYASGELVKADNAGTWTLYRATAATTGDDPTAGTPWETPTEPFVMWGEDDPVGQFLADSVPPAPGGSIYIYSDADSTPTPWYYDSFHYGNWITDQWYGGGPPILSEDAYTAIGVAFSDFTQPAGAVPFDKLKALIRHVMDGAGDGGIDGTRTFIRQSDGLGATPVGDVTTGDTVLLGTGVDGTGKILNRVTHEDSGAVTWEMAAVASQAYIKVTGLPTSDPGQAGHLYTLNGVLKVSGT